MTAIEKRKLIGMNAAIWAISMLLSFVLPFIAESISSGPAKLFQVICFALPLIAGMWVSSVVISKSIRESVT